MRIGLLASYPPRRCGIATFTHDLWQAFQRVNGDGPDPVVIAMNTPAAIGLEYPDEVRFEVNREVHRDYRQAAHFVNTSDIDVLCVQLEFGLFGGEAGGMLFEMLRRVGPPVVTTMHTVLLDPPEPFRRATLRAAELSSKLAVISKTACGFLESKYGVGEEQITHIPHGAPDYPYLDPADYKLKFDMAGRKVVMTFGLLGPNKGLETALEAIARIAGDHPDLLYVILGATHPEVRKTEGEKYRLVLQRRVEQLGLTEHVVFVNRFVELEELCEYLLAADAFVTPYPSREQISSGTLTYALALGKAIVSTDYYYAEELLADGRGVVVPASDPAAMGDALNALLSDDARRNLMRREAYQFGRRLTWSAVAKRYLEVFEEVCRSQARRRPQVVGPTVVTGAVLPELKLEHLMAITDETGVLRDARFHTPRWEHGYTTDDNARALIVAVRNQGATAAWEAERFIGRYLAFLFNAQQDDGLFRNSLGYDRRWAEEGVSEDCCGRCIWAAGYALRYAERPAFQAMAKEIMERAIPAASSLSHLRPKAYAILGLADYLALFGGARDARNLLTQFATDLTRAFEETANRDWQWFEDIITYGNGNLPYSLFVAAEALDSTDHRDVALASLAFLDTIVWDDGHLSLVGQDGWYRHGGERTRFDQQPLEALALVRAYRAAYTATGDTAFLARMRKSFEWFLGDNDVGQPLVDFQSGACADGLTPTGPRLDCGAEATLAYIAALSCMQDMQAEETASDPSVGEATAHEPDGVPA